MKKLLIIGFVFIIFISFASASLTTDIESYWKFDGDATDAVSSNDGTVTGATNSASYGKIKQGYLFDSSTEKIVVPSSSELNIVGDITLSFWINPDSGTTTNAYIIGKRSATNVAKPYNVYNINGKFYFYRGNGVSQWSVTSDNSISYDTWTHVVITQSGQDVKFYYNGVQSGATETIGTGTPTGSTESLYITNNAANGASFYGYLDEISIWSRALSSTEISELYNSGSGLQYPFLPTIAFYISATNSTSNLTSFSANVKNSTINYTYSTTNGTIKTNSSNSWVSGYYDISITADGYANWGIENFYWSSTEKNNLRSVLSVGGGTSNTCTGNFFVSSNCEAIIQNGDTYVVQI